MGLTGEEAGLVTLDGGGYLIRFKFIELIEKLKISLLT